MSYLAATYRVAPTPQQAAQFAAWSDACRAFWNVALEQRETAWSRTRSRVGFAQQSREVKDVRAAFPFMARPPANALHRVLVDLEQAYANWFAGRAARPKWKSAKRNRRAFRLLGPDVALCASGTQIRISKVGRVSAYISRPLPGRAVAATISERAGRWNISILCEVAEANPALSQNPPIGVDLGIANTVALSNGEFIQLACPTAGDWRKLARHQRRLSRRVLGSRGSRRSLAAIMRWHESAANRRNDFAAKLATELTGRFGLVALEDLAVARMTRRRAGRGRAAKAALNRELLARAFGTLRGRLEQRAPRFGSTVVAVDPRYTSQTCAICGHVAKENRESQAVFRCVGCGHEAHADTNAALNILSRAGQARVYAGGVGSLEGPTLNPEPRASSERAVARPAIGNLAFAGGCQSLKARTVFLPRPMSQR